MNELRVVEFCIRFDDSLCGANYKKYSLYETNAPDKVITKVMELAKMSKIKDLTNIEKMLDSLGYICKKYDIETYGYKVD